MNAVSKAIRDQKRPSITPEMRTVFDAHLDAIFASDQKECNAAVARRNAALVALEPQQRAIVDVLARGFGRAFLMEVD